MTETYRHHVIVETERAFSVNGPMIDAQFTVAESVDTERALSVIHLDIDNAYEQRTACRFRGRIFQDSVAYSWLLSCERSEPQVV